MPAPNPRIATWKPTPPRHDVETLPPPSRGMNRAQMALNGRPDEALLIENWIIDQFGASVREGWSVFCENVGLAVGPAVSIFTSQTPGTPNANDGTTYEMGTKFTVAHDGQISAIRYWKAASETGSHTGRIWNGSGVQIASVTFAGETASGWQVQALSAPLAVVPGETYTVSVNVNQYYVTTSGGLSSPITNGDLTAPANGGVFGTISTYPTTTFGNSNYFRDVVFAPNAATATQEVTTLIAAHDKNVVPNLEDPYITPGPGKLFASTDDGIYDVTTSSATPPKVFTLSGTAPAGLINYTQFSTTGGLFVAACSEKDGYLIYNVQTNTWSKPVQGLGAGQVGSSGTDTTCDPAKFVFVVAWKKRLMFVERDTSKVWFLPVDQLTGECKPFQFGPLMSHGGVLSEMANWTLDAGEGIDDHLVLLGSKGDIAIYKGTDPGDVNAFSLVGVWYLGSPPAGRRAMTQYGGEVLVFTEMGVTPVSALKDAAATRMTDLALKIRPLVANHVAAFASEYGWDLTHFPAKNLLVVNTPPGNASSCQYVLALNFNAWTLWTGMPALCWEVFNHRLYFGTPDGRVCLALYDDLDEMSRTHEGGRAIVSKLIGAFLMYKQPSLVKQFHMIRPVIDARMKPQAHLWMNVDYRLRDDQASPAFRPITVSHWDQDKWDSARWAGTHVPYNDWFSVEGQGRVGAYGFAMSSIGGVKLYQLDVMFELTRRVF